MNERSILLSSIVAVLIAGMVGVIGMLGNYSFFPSMISEPTCECVKIHEDYEKLRQLFSVVGFLYGLVVICIWQIYVRYDLKREEQKELVNNGSETL